MRWLRVNASWFDYFCLRNGMKSLKFCNSRGHGEYSCLASDTTRLQKPCRWGRNSWSWWCCCLCLSTLGFVVRIPVMWFDLKKLESHGKMCRNVVQPSHGLSSWNSFRNVESLWQSFQFAKKSLSSAHFFPVRSVPTICRLHPRNCRVRPRKFQHWRSLRFPC